MDAKLKAQEDNVGFGEGTGLRKLDPNCKFQDRWSRYGRSSAAASMNNGAATRLRSSGRANLYLLTVHVITGPDRNHLKPSVAIFLWSILFIMGVRKIVQVHFDRF